MQTLSIPLDKTSTIQKYFVSLAKTGNLYLKMICLREKDCHLCYRVTLLGSKSQNISNDVNIHLLVILDLGHIQHDILTQICRH